MNNIKLEDVCKKESSNIKQSDLANNNGDYPIYGASGLIKKVDFKEFVEYLIVGM